MALMNALYLDFIWMIQKFWKILHLAILFWLPVSFGWVMKMQKIALIPDSMLVVILLYLQMHHLKHHYHQEEHHL